jgi:hypothetical protein
MQTEIQIPSRIPIGIPREFLPELEKIAGEYREAKRTKYPVGVDLAVDCHFRRFLEGQCDYLCKLAKLRSTLPLGGTDWDFLEAVSALKLIVHNNKYWNRFSQRIKNRDSLEFPQTRYAN